MQFKVSDNGKSLSNWESGLFRPNAWSASLLQSLFKANSSSSQSQLLSLIGDPLHWLPTQVLLLLSHKSHTDLHPAVMSSTDSLFPMQLSCLPLLSSSPPCHAAVAAAFPLLLVSCGPCSPKQSPATSWVRTFPLTWLGEREVQWGRN